MISSLSRETLSAESRRAWAFRCADPHCHLLLGLAVAFGWGLQCLGQSPSLHEPSVPARRTSQGHWIGNAGSIHSLESRHARQFSAMCHTDIRGCRCVGRKAVLEEKVQATSSRTCWGPQGGRYDAGVQQGAHEDLSHYSPTPTSPARGPHCTYC